MHRGPVGGHQTVRQRVVSARAVQQARDSDTPDMRGNAEGEALSEFATTTPEAHELPVRAAEQFKLFARGYRRVPRVARTIADLDGFDDIQKNHITEAINFRLPTQLDG